MQTVAVLVLGCRGADRLRRPGVLPPDPGQPTAHRGGEPARRGHPHRGADGDALPLPRPPARRGDGAARPRRTDSAAPDPGAAAPHPLLLWLACLGLIALDVGLGLSSGVHSSPFLLVNNVILGVVTIGAANLWAQSGMKAREVAILAAVLTAYDVVATWQLTVMTDVFQRLARAAACTGRRLGPVGSRDLAAAGPWRSADPHRRHRSSSERRSAGPPVWWRWQAGSSSSPRCSPWWRPVLRTCSVPVMAVLGPLIVGQYLYWRRARGAERTTASTCASSRCRPAGRSRRPVHELSAGSERG